MSNARFRTLHVVDTLDLTDAVLTGGGIEVDAARNFALGGEIETDATDGFLYIPTCAGTPVGTPTVKTGLAAIVFNATNNTLNIHQTTGSGWVSVALT